MSCRVSPKKQRDKQLIVRNHSSVALANDNPCEALSTTVTVNEQFIRSRRLLDALLSVAEIRGSTGALTDSSIDIESRSF